MKIFGIGLPRTGTATLAEGLRLLGLEVEHSPLDLQRLDALDGATGIPVALAYQELDRKYPGSRFVLTERELESWLASTEPWFHQTEDVGEDVKRPSFQLFGTEVFDRAHFTAAYHRHRAEVLRYFAERPADLLVMDIRAGDAWDKLCPFVERPVPETPFPGQAENAAELQHAFEMHRAGRLAVAKAAYLRVLEAEPTHPEALHHLGLVNHQEGHNAEAERLIREAIALRPREIRYRLNLATVLRNGDRGKEADAALREAAELQSATAAACIESANADMGRNDRQGAMNMLRMALALEPHHAEAALRLGKLLLHARRPKEAVPVLERVLPEAPHHLAAQSRKAVAFAAMQELPEAIRLAEALVADNPDAFEAHYAAGCALQAAERHGEAVHHYERAVAIDPGDPGAHYDLANSLGMLKRHEQALTHYRLALQLQPNRAVFHNNLANALIHLERYGEAIEHCQAAIRLRPELAEAHANLGFAYQRMDRLDEAMAWTRKALELKPDAAQFHTNLAAMLQRRFRVDEAIPVFREALRLAPELAPAHSSLLYLLTYLDPESPEALYQEHREFGRQLEKRFTAAGHAPGRWAPDKPVQVGFVSPDFRAHPVATFMTALFKHYDPEQIAITCYSDVAKPDIFTRDFEGMAGRWRNIHGLPDGQVIEQIGQDGIQVLVDLCGHMADNRLPLFACKPAPVQVAYMGYMNTTGMRAMDYWLTDRVLNPPETQPHFAERFWYLPGCFICYTPPRVQIPVAPPPLLRNGFPTFGVFNNSAKITPRAVGVWARLLQALPDAKLMIRSMPLADEANRDTMRQRFAAHGIAPERLIIIGRSGKVDYLRDFGRIDVALDTFPNNGNTTTNDTLWMGVPTVALAGNTCVGRMGVTLLGHLGHPEWVAESHEQYIQVAIDLVRHPARLKAQRLTLREEMLASPLCDGKRFARSMEEALRGMWQKWCTERQPAGKVAATP